MLEKRIDYGIKLIGAASLALALWGGANYYTGSIKKNELRKEYTKNNSEDKWLASELYSLEERNKKDHSKMCLGILGTTLIGAHYFTKKYDKY